MNTLGNVTISSGGTIVPIDKMRVLSNKSSGSSGAKLAETFINDRQNIQFVNAGKGLLPYIHRIQKTPLSTNIDLIEERYKALRESVKSGSLSILECPLFEDYLKTMTAIAEQSNPGDIALMAAAVSDYEPETIYDGKISSQNSHLSIDLIKAPKVIDAMREVSRSLTMIGFKLIPDSGNNQLTEGKLIENSIRQMQGPSQTDMVIANASNGSVHDPHIHISKTLFVYPDGSSRNIRRSHLYDALKETLPDLVRERINNIT